MNKRKFDDVDDEPRRPHQPPPGSLKLPQQTLPQRDRHFAELYKAPPDFQALALRDAAFSKFVGGGHDLDFQNPDAVMQLTKTLLKLDFDLEVDLPEDRLCPPVANRHNYILWLKDLLDSTTYDHDPAAKKLLGLDIGTGASCIYPLLGCRQRDWSFIATDIDEKNIQYAKENVRSNSLLSRINVLHRSPTASVIPEGNSPSIDFTMTNPPFYSSAEAMMQSAVSKKRKPYTACTGSPTEMVTQGGEISFVLRILDESLSLHQSGRGRIQWYTAMLGFLSSLTAVIDKLKENKTENYAVTEFAQGSKTRRWAIAWSFCSMRPSLRASRGTKSVPKNLLPPITEVEAFEGSPSTISQGRFAHHVKDAVAGLGLLTWDWDAQMMEGTGRASENVWGRAYRRRKKREMDINMGEGEKGKANTDAAEERCAFGFRIAVRVSRERTTVTVRWMEGREYALYESFQGWLKARCEMFKVIEE